MRLKNYLLHVRVLFVGTLLGFSLTAAGQQTYTFTNAGATDEIGPTQAQLNTAYTGTTLDGQVTSNGGIQEWTVPQSGNYKIEAYGAQGYGPFGGRGAYIAGEFILNANDQLKILVGQQGGCCVGSGTNQYGGGGGSFVTDINDNPLIVAGGGGGSWANAHTVDTDASVTTAGNAGVNGASAVGGTNGSGGGSASNADGGAGISGDGGGTAGGQSFINGGLGGTTTGSGGNGGFGGGGGGSSWDNRRSGGGGGYSGGGGSEGGTSGLPEGGGGGSFNSGNNQVDSVGVGTGHGLVIIELLTPPSPNDVGVSSIDAPGTEVTCPSPTDIVVTVQNFGSDLLGFFNVTYEVDGVVQNTMAYSGAPLDTATGTTGPHTVSLNLGSYVFDQNKTYEIKAYASDPNGVQDTVPTNDTAELEVEARILEAHIVDQEDVSCPGGMDGFAIAGSASDSAKYFWSVGDTGETISTLPAGEHKIVVEDDGFSCNDTVTFVIEEPDPIEIERAEGGATCQGVADGYLKVDASGGTAPYDFNWNNGGSRADISNLTAGSYRLTVTDANGCTASGEFEIENPEVLRVSVEEILPANCTSEEGSVELSPSGGTPPYSYEWSDGQQVKDPANLSAGTYEVTVTDDAGCEQIKNIEIPELNTNITHHKPDTLRAEYEGDVMYQWFNCASGEFPEEGNDPDFIPGEPGSYGLIITYENCSDTSGCAEVIYTTGVEERFSGISQIEVYPNPSSGSFNLRMTGNSNDPVEVELLDMQGKMLHSRRLGSVHGELTEEFNTDLSAGMYLIKVTHNDSFEVKRIVVR